MKRVLFSVVCLFVFLASVYGEEGYDPLIQITHQFAKPNMLIVLDVSGSMAWNMSGSNHNVGVDSTGFPYWSLSRTTGSPCQRYKFLATLVNKDPSRMVILKNALGNSVSYYEMNFNAVSEATWMSIPLNSGWQWKGKDGSGRPQWLYCSNSSSSPASRPFTVTESCPGLTTHPPKDLIGQTRNSVNWALVIYSGDRGNCSSASIKTQFDLSEMGDVTVLENLLKLKSAGGLGTGGATPTRGAMTFAKTYLRAALAGSTINDFDEPNTNDKNTWTFTQDSKFFACDRAYGAILVTDGQSNNCNPSNNEWSNCPTNWSSYPPGAINQLYFDPAYSLTYGGLVYKPIIKTWVIGVSPEVSRCEINFNAYMGRTDANAPAGDAGFDTSKDLDRLPPMNTYVEGENQLHPGRIHYTTLISGHEQDNFNPGLDYGYFASDAEALADAFAAIVAGVATGDYTTSSPVASPLSTSTSNQAFLASAEFPSWNGHLYCFDTTGDVGVLVYDAGEKLAAQPSSARRIYTWDTSGQLIEVTADNLNLLKIIATSFNPTFDSSTLTTQVIDFIRGNDGNGISREWKLGGIINSTPTIVNAPEMYKQNTVDVSHNQFTALYSSRKPLMYVGADDGMLHCFLITDESEDGTKPYFGEGYELFAILPPNLLSKQPTLYSNFVNNGIVTGQEKQPKNHIYGIANSPRYGDVYLGNGVWKTVLFLTEGPGGEMLAALDITDPLGNLLKSPPEPPTSILWYHTPLTCPYLRKTWSIPALASVNSQDLIGIIGSGYDEASSTSPKVFVFDAKNGALLDTESISAAAGTTWVKNQSFADSLLLQTQIGKYSPDNLADIGIQADLHGRLWFYDVTSKTILGNIDASAKAGCSQPIYYPPAASGYYISDSKNYDIYVFASGTPYEKDVDVTGPNVGLTSGSPKPFMPSIYVAIQNPWQKNPPASTKVIQIPIQDLTWKDNDGVVHNFGRRTQVTSPPMMIVPETSAGSSKPTALFSLYDPDTTDCAGTSYVIVLTIDISETGNATVSHSGYSAGSGAASGFAIIGRSVVVAKSGIGEGKRASVSKVPGVTPTWNTGQPAPVMWRELQ